MFSRGFSLASRGGRHICTPSPSPRILRPVSQNFKAKNYAALNKDILPKVDWRALGYSCEKRDGDYSKDILQQMHNAFAECYESTELSGDMGFVAVPAVVLGKDNQMCLALVDLDTCSSGEHWGTTFFTPYGVYQEEAECHPLAREFARAMIPSAILATSLALASVVTIFPW